jgi:voltage-gated potassium channel Kch
MAKATNKQRFRYWFDNLMSKGPVAMMSLLAFSSLIVVVFAGAILWIFEISPQEGTPVSFIEGVWESLMRTLDPGTMGSDEGWPYRFVALIATLGGIFIVSTLIGVLSNAINSRLDELRKGKSFVVEENHTLILGWSSKIITIISELVMANENDGHPRIVILADKDKVEMEDEIRSKIKDLKNTKVICRSGNPADITELNIVNPQATASIIVLAPEDANADPMTIKIILAITNHPDRRKEPYHIVAEIKDEKNLEVVQLIGKDEVEILQTDDIIGKIMVQTSRQSGLSIVYMELLDFYGSEIYFADEPRLIGKTYGEVLQAYDDSAVLGVQYANGGVRVNPHIDYVFQPGDKVIAITENDDTLIMASNQHPTLQGQFILNRETIEKKTERILMLGWNKRALVIIREMDKYVAPGSYMKVVSTYDTEKKGVLATAKNLRNIQLEFQQADTTARNVIDELDIVSYDCIQLLCYKEELELQDADAQTLISLLHIRRILDTTNHRMTIVSEMLDMRNRDLAEVTHADDFIVSDRIISLLMAQVSYNKYLMRVYDDLFNKHGNEIYLKPMQDYVQIGEKISFATVQESAKRRGETAIGYRFASMAHDTQRKYGIVVNPNKTKMLIFGELDKIIVIAEN